MRQIRFGLCCLLCLALAGCGSGLKLYPVKGRVTMGGQPVADASVLFQPKGGESGGPAVPTGVTNAQGEFELETVNALGAPEGDYIVTVTKYKELGINADETVAPEGVTIEWLVPQLYSKPETSGLSAKVPSAEPKAYEFALEPKR